MVATVFLFIFLIGWFDDGRVEIRNGSAVVNAGLGVGEVDTVVGELFVLSLLYQLLSRFGLLVESDSGFLS